MPRRWRSTLFVPGNRPDLAAKAEARCAPDVLVLDLEDAVPAGEKAAARAAVAKSAAALLAGPTSVAVCVRVNPPTSDLFHDDVAAMPPGLTALVVPKLEGPITIGDVAVVAGIETVRGVADARTILAGDAIVACYFGAEDYVTDLGGIRTRGNAEVQTARALVGMAARLAGVPALDMVTADFGDHDRFRAEATEARALGYAGKLCIHPTQVGLADEAFRPSDAEVERARRLLAAHGAADGRTISFQGQMVDEVIAVQARRILDDPPGPGPIPR